MIFVSFDGKILSGLISPITLTDACPSSGRGRDYFLQDPAFPGRLIRSGYYRTTDFLRTLFQDYARYGLSVPSDRVVAISGLTKRMEDVWQSECRYGVFSRYMHRLLLWRRRDATGSTFASPHDLEFRIQVPSWSWMVCSQIEFIPAPRLVVSPPEELYFDPEPGKEQRLSARIREIDNYKVRQDGAQLSITDAEDQDVGACWPDMSFDISLKRCVVIGMDSSYEYGGLVDEERTYYVIFVKHESGENLFERIGAGRIKARCVSMHACEGRLV